MTDTELMQKKLIDQAMELGADDCMVFHVSDLAFDPRTLLKCLGGCPYYLHYCPMARDPQMAKALKEIAQAYSWGVLIRTHDLAVGQDITLAVERTAFLDGYTFAAACTECAICEVCSIEDERPCIDITKLRMPFYAMGIDVYKTVRKLGWELNVLQSKDEIQSNITAVFVE